MLATTLSFGLVPASQATETVNIHERVNNARAPAYRTQSASVPSTIQGETFQMAGMDQHERIIITHEIMNNGSAEAHQKMAENHQKMMENIAVNDARPLVSFAAMNEREGTAVAHETMNNDQSGAHQAMAEAHRRVISAG